MFNNICIYKKNINLPTRKQKVKEHEDDTYSTYAEKDKSNNDTDGTESKWLKLFRHVHKKIFFQNCLFFKTIIYLCNWKDDLIMSRFFAYSFFFYFYFNKNKGEVLCAQL